MNLTANSIDTAQLAQQIKEWGLELGFQQVGISPSDLTAAETRFQYWLDKKRHGNMGYMESHGLKRSRPNLLVPGTQSIISVRMDYLPEPMPSAEQILQDPYTAFVSRYALGRDYHKLMRRKLQKLAKIITESIGEFGYRAFVDSAPVLEKPIAQQAGLGWTGKHTNIINSEAGSWFFLGELFTDIQLPADAPAEDHCGSCNACITVCPTQAIVAPYELDARLCISYLTIELQDAIPVHLRPLLGNRIYGCDDCQLACPWNKFAQLTLETDYLPRQGLDSASLQTLFSWTEPEFLRRTEGSPIRRIGHQRWLRNIAVALGNAPTCPEVTEALLSRAQHPSEQVREHVQWALEQHTKATLEGAENSPDNT